MIQSPPNSPQMDMETGLPKKHKVAIIFTASSCFFVSSTLLVLYVANAAAVLPLNVAAFLSLYSPIVVCALIVTISTVASVTSISSYKSNEKHQAESVEQNNNHESPIPATTVSAEPPSSSPSPFPPPPPPPPPPGGFFSQSGPKENRGITSNGVKNSSSGTDSTKPAEGVDRDKMLEKIREGVTLRKTSERPLPPKKPDQENTQDSWRKEAQEKLNDRRKAMFNTSDSEWYSGSDSDSDQWSDKEYDPVQRSTEKPVTVITSNRGTTSDQQSPNKPVISSSKTAPVGSTDIKNYQQPSKKKPNRSNNEETAFDQKSLRNSVNMPSEEKTPPAVPTSVNNSSFSVRKRVKMFGG